MSAAVVLFSRDIRIRDHPAMTAAGRAGFTVPLFIVSESLVRHLRPSANRLQYLADALADLDGALRRRGGTLVVR